MPKIKTILFSVIIFVVASHFGACESTQDEEPNAIIVVSDLDSLQQKTKQLAGDDAVDCGDIRIIEIDAVYPDTKADADCCVAISLAQGKPFHVMYQEIDADSIRGRGYLSNELGELSVGTWDSVAPGGGLHHYWPFKCESLVLADDVCSVPTNELPICVIPK